ncbi:MAG: family 20 glycosylhydrolase [Bacilli bacterium]|nr:family 20 glycosylhydrolase [Bacilli bacterium]
MNYLIPVPKEISYFQSSEKKTLDIAACQTIDYASFFDERLETLTEIIVDSYSSTKRNGLIKFKYQKLGSEAYHLLIRDRVVTIKAEDLNGCYYALRTLQQLAKKYNGLIPLMTIKDKPDMAVRGFQLDISRSKVSNLKTIFELIDLLSYLKYNQLQLYVEGFSFEYQSMPFVNKDKNFISVSEYKQIEKYANDHFIDLVPNQNGFGHMGEWLKLDEFKHLSNVEGLFNIWGSNRYSTTLDPTNEESYLLVKRMYDDMLPHANSKYFNMNFDEPYELGYGKSKESCDKLGKEIVYANYFNKLAQVVKSYGKTPMLWGDVVIHNPESIKVLDPDAILIDWGYVDDYQFVEHAKILRKLKRPFIMAGGTSTWAAVTSKYSEMIWSMKNAAEAVYHYGGLGIMLTDWGDFGHLQYFPFTLPGIVYTSLLSWNYTKASDHLIKECLTELLENEHLAKMIIELSNYHLNEEHYRGYSTKLFNPIVQAELVQTETSKLEVFKKKVGYGLLSENEIAYHNIYLNHIEEKLNLEVENTLIHQELRNAILLLKTLLDVNIFLRGCLNNQIDLKLFDVVNNNLTKYLKNHKQLWCARNKEPGFVYSSQRIERLQQCLEMLKKEANDYET